MTLHLRREGELYIYIKKFISPTKMTKVYNEEFTGTLREIVQRVPFFNSPYGKNPLLIMVFRKRNSFNDLIDRVRIVEWTRRLACIPDDTIDNAKNRNDYIQLLKIMVRGGRLHGIFHKSLPDSEIPPLGEAMANVFSDQCPDLPRPGPVEPVICRKTPDGCAYLAIRKIPDRGILCYMAVSPDGLSRSDTDSQKDDADPEDTRY